MTGPAGLSLGVDDATCRQLTGRACLEQPNSQPVDASNPQLAAPGAQGAASPIAGGLATTPGTTGGLPLPDVLANPPVIPPPPVRDGSEVPAAPAETPPPAQEEIPAGYYPRADYQEDEYGTSGGEPHVSAEAEVEGGQASPPVSYKIESVSDLKIFLRSLGIDDSKITDEMLEDGHFTHDELEEVDPNHERYITDEAFNLVGRGGLGINVFGGVASDEDGIGFADGERFMDKVIEPLVDGTKSQAAVISRFMHASRFRVIPRHALSRTFREQTHSKEGLWETTNGVSTLSAKTFLDKYIRPELKDLAAKVLANILGHAVTDADRLDEEQLDTFMLTIYYLARIDTPREVMEGAKAITDLTDQLEGSTPETFITWLTKGAENPVQAESTSSADQQGQQAADMPEELREGMKHLYHFDNGQFVTGTDNKPLPLTFTSTEEQRQAYQEAIGHFEKVISNNGTTAIYRKQAAELLLQCYQELSRMASNGEEIGAVIALAEGQLGTITNIEGIESVISLRKLWMSLIQLVAPRSEDLMFAQIQALAAIYTRSDVPGLVPATIPGEIASLAETCAGLRSVQYRRYALELAEQVKTLAPERFYKASQTEGQQGGGQLEQTETFMERIKQAVENHPLLIEAETKFYDLLRGLGENPLPASQLSTKLTEIAGDYQRAIEALTGDADPISVEDLAQAQAGRARCLAYAALPGMILGSEMEGAALTSAAQTLLNLLKEVVGIDPEQEFAPTGAGLLALSITTLNGLIAQAADPEDKERLEGLRDYAIRTLVIIAQTLVQASTAHGVDSAAKAKYKEAYRAIARLMGTLGLEGVSLQPNEPNGEPTPLDGPRGLISALAHGLRTSISPREMQRRIAEETVGTPPPAPRDRHRRDRRRRS